MPLCLDFCQLASVLTERAQLPSSASRFLARDAFNSKRAHQYMASIPDVSFQKIADGAEPLSAQATALLTLGGSAARGQGPASDLQAAACMALNSARCLEALPGLQIEWMVLNDRWSRTPCKYLASRTRPAASHWTGTPKLDKAAALPIFAGP
eukprot:14937789-Alexandrium_andersonii.AAC.1